MTLQRLSAENSNFRQSYPRQSGMPHEELDRADGGCAYCEALKLRQGNIHV